MRLNELHPAPGSRKRGKRVGRGIGSGKGKTAGRGHKGQKSRSGAAIGAFEGGQMPIYRRLPKRGFRLQAPKRFAEVGIGRIQELIDAGRLDAGETIDEAALVAAGAVRRARQGVRVLGNGEIRAKIALRVAHVTASAKAAVEAAGGSVETTWVPKKKRRAAAAGSDA